MAITGPITVTTTDSAGAATGSATPDPDHGISYLTDVKLTYNSAPATTKVVISEVGGLGKTLLSIIGNTDGIFPARTPTYSALDGALTGGFDLVQFSGQLQVDVTLSDALDPAVTVELEYLDNRDIA